MLGRKGKFWLRKIKYIIVTTNKLFLKLSFLKNVSKPFYKDFFVRYFKIILVLKIKFIFLYI